MFEGTPGPKPGYIMWLEWRRRIAFIRDTNTSAMSWKAELCWRRAAGVGISPLLEQFGTTGYRRRRRNCAGSQRHAPTSPCRTNGCKAGHRTNLRKSTDGTRQDRPR